MRRFLIIILTLLCININSVSASVNSDCIKYNGNKYVLLYSGKSVEHNGYYNQYFKSGEDFDSWSEMIAVQHYPNVYSPIDLANIFRDYLGECHCPSSMTVDNNKNISVLDFILIDDSKKSFPITLEFNIFKYVKSSDCGTLSMQYAKKFLVYNQKDADKIKKNFAKYRPKALDEILKTNVPNIVNRDIGEINLNDLP